MITSVKLKNRLKTYIKKNAFNDWDTVTINMSYSKSVPSGTIYSDEAIAEFAQKFLAAAVAGKHPTLNPFIDILEKYRDDEVPEFLNTFTKFILEEGDFETEPLDDTKDYLKISCSFAILLGNLKSFLSDDFTINDAVIQTALFKLNVGDDLEE